MDLAKQLDFPMVMGPIYDEMSQDYWNILVVFFGAFAAGTSGLSMWIGYLWIKDIIINS